jgi:serine/threonine-protein kinase
VIAGAAIGPYRIVKKIGEGGMGAVFMAEHTLLGRAAAIKVLLPSLSSQREVVDRFFNEARATTAVKDPGIVQVFDFGFHADGSAYIVMELLEGESLDARIHRGTLAVADALRITRQVAGSLAAAHARGIVHRDLKPDNLFMVRDAEAQSGERPKILDFGIAKLTGDTSDRMRTRTGMVMGTPVYMSPEQCRGAGTVDHRSDIYSLGCVLYHLLTGHPPFDLEGVGEIISAHLREPAKPPGVTAAIDALVLRCLEKAPEQRFQSMTELQAACEAQLARITGANAQTVAIPADLVKPPPTTFSSAAGEAAAQPRRRGIAWLAAGGAIAIGLVIFVATRPGGGDDTPAASTAAAAPAPLAAVPAATPAAPPPDATVASVPATVPPAVPVIDAPPIPIDAAPVPKQLHKPVPNRPHPTKPSTEGDPYEVR